MGVVVDGGEDELCADAVDELAPCLLLFFGVTLEDVGFCGGEDGEFLWLFWEWFDCTSYCVVLL